MGRDLSQQLHDGGSGVDVVINIDAISKGHYNRLFAINSIGVMKMINAVTLHGVRRFIQVSAMSIEKHMTNGSSIIGSSTYPLDLYSVSKWVAEYVLSSPSNEFASCIVRSPAIVGESAKNHFLARLAHSLRNNEPTIELTNPDFLFNYVIHEYDLATFIVHLASSDISAVKPIQVGTIPDSNLKEITDDIIKIFNRGSNITWSNEPIMPASINLSHACELGFHPRKTMATIKEWLDLTYSNNDNA